MKAKCESAAKRTARAGRKRCGKNSSLLSKAYGMPRETEEQKAEKARVMAIVLKDACS